MTILSRWLRLCLLLVLLICICIVTFWAARNWFQPRPIRVLRANYGAITDYAARVGREDIPMRADGQGYLISEVLYHEGATFVRREQGYVRIIFPSLPPDATEELIYCPHGHNNRLPLIRTHRHVCEWKVINDQWLYLVHDY